jgi:hypothetical protein
MLKYITKAQAVKEGFTNHGSYYGIPVWIANNNYFMVAAKWEPMELAITAAQYVEGFISFIFYPDSEPEFMFKLGPKIDGSKK